MYLSGTDTVGFSTASTLRMQMNASGNLSIGAGTSTNRVISMGKSITGNATSYGILNLGAVQSDVTTSAAYYATSGGTQATAFTLGQLNHFYAIQGTVGAGSTVTNQMGYNVDASLIGATNNFGFYGQVPAGTNRWNAYMVGSAANYFNGQTSIGTTVLTLGSGSVDHQLGVLSTAAARVGMVIRGAASQTGDLLQVQNSAATKLFTIDSAGNVGIGTASPAAKLDVVGASGGANQLIVSDGSNQGRIQIGKSANFYGIAAGADYLGMQFYSNSSTSRMNIDTTGNVGIGITPTALLHVVTSSTTAYGLISRTPIVGLTAGNTVNMAYFADSRGASNDGLRIYNLRDVTSAGVGSWENSSFHIQRNVDGGTYQGDIGFGNSTITFGISGAERMRVAGNGFIGIGVTSPSSQLTVGANPPTAGALGVVGANGGIALALSDNVNSSLYVRNMSGGSTIGTDAGGALHLASNGNGASERRLTVDATGATTVSYTTTTGKAVRNTYMSTSDPSGGADGDVWIKYTA